MISDLEMIVKEFPDKESIKIYPIFDVHLGAREHLEKEWAAFCKRILTEQNSYIILGGDLISNGVKNSLTNVYEEVYRPREQKRIITEMLMPLKDKILCAVKGNHEARSSRETDSDIIYDIMCKLDIENLYRENVAFVHLYFGKKGNNSKYNPSYVLCVAHGAGGGALTGGSVNRAERFAYSMSGVDALIVGHTHKPLVTSPAQITVDPTKERIFIRPFKVVVASSWLTWGGYAAQKMLTPTANVPQILNVRGDKRELTVTM